MEAEKTIEEIKQQKNEIIVEIKRLGELKEKLNELILCNNFYRAMISINEYPNTQEAKECREEREKIEQTIIKVEEAETKFIGILETLEQLLRKGNVPV